MNESLKSLLFGEDLEIVTKDTEREKTIEKYKKTEDKFGFICTQCDWKSNSFTRYTEHIHLTHHKVNDVSGLVEF